MKRLLSLTVGAMLASGIAAAQAQPIPREDNIWGGYAHQPSQSELAQRETIAGLTPSQQQQQTANDELQSIYRSLMQQTSPTP